MEWSHEILEPYSFSRRMEELKSAATHGLARRPYLGQRTKRVRQPPCSFVGSKEAAAMLGVSETVVKRLAAAGRLPGAFRRRLGRGRPLAVPVHLQPDGTYAITVISGSRGPKSAYALSAAELIPF